MVIGLSSQARLSSQAFIDVIGNCDVSV